MYGHVGVLEFSTTHLPFTTREESSQQHLDICKMTFLFFFSFFKKRFIYLWLHWVFIAARGLLLLQSMGFRAAGFSSCGSWALEYRLNSFGAWCLLPLRHVGSFQTRD